MAVIHMNDTLIENVTIVDGTMRLPYQGAVSLIGDTIGGVFDTPFPKLKAGWSLDGQGLILAPGFIDLHTHSDFTLVVDPGADSLLRQGVTTEVIGNCGHGVAPLGGEHAEELLSIIFGYDPSVAISWSSFADYLDYLDAQPLSLNVGVLAAHGPIRCAVMGLHPRAASPSEIKQMCRYLEEALSAGAIGLSTGLAYAPGANAEEEELMALAKTASEAGGFYTSHIRNEDRRINSAVREALNIGFQSGMPVHLSHHPVKYPAFGQSSQTLAMIDDARGQGLDATCDLHGYIGGATSMAQLLPPWAFEGGASQLLRRLNDPGRRRQMKRDMRRGLPGVAQARLVEDERWSELFLESSRASPDVVGWSIAEMAYDRDVPALDVVLDLLLAEGEKGGNCYNAVVLGWIYSPNDNTAVLTHHSSMIASDGRSLSRKGPLQAIRSHPRSYGTYPRVLRKYVRELGILDVPSAIAKMTSAPAARAGLKDRGVIQSGYKADLVLFDPKRVADRATYDSPSQYPIGIQHVWVNGTLSVAEGESVHGGNGKVLRRQ